jgi:hypothetical protein
MHDPKSFNNEEVQRFEKEVQQKMEGLEFSPSEAVWANVAQAVNDGKKRRRAPLFWLFFISAFLLMGTAGVYFIGGHSQPENNQLNKNDQQAGPDQHPANDQLTKNNQQAKNDQEANVQQPNGQSATNSLPPDHKQPNAQSTAINQSAKVNQSSTITSPASDNSAAIRSGTLRHPAAGAPEDNSTEVTAGTHSTAKPGSAPGGTTRQKNKKPAITGTENVQPLAKNGSDKSPAEDGSDNPSARLAAAGGNTTTADNTGSPDRTGTAGANRGSGSAATGDQGSIGKISKINLSPVSGRNSPKITAAPLASKYQALTKTQLNPKHPWEAGFTGGIGVSSLNQAFLKRSTVAAAYNNRNSMAAITGQPQINISKIQPDLSFWAGIFMQKQLLKNISVSVGLNLHYYSTRISTGDKVDLSNNAYSLPGPGLSSSQTISSFAAAPPPQSYPYYAAGDKQTFINRYYFLEIPGSIQWQISHSRVLPLFWEAGFSLSYLMSSNALYYNTKAGVYYKDANVTNKVQFNISTALMVGLPFKGIDLQAGPQVQYGVTSLLNTENNGQHLFYGGLKFVVIPQKSGKAGRRLFRDQ